MATSMPSWDLARIMMLCVSLCAVHTHASVGLSRTVDTEAAKLRVQTGTVPAHRSGHGAPSLSPWRPALRHSWPAYFSADHSDQPPCFDAGDSSMQRIACSVSAGHTHAAHRHTL